MVRWAALGLMLALVAACGGREARPIPTVFPGDEGLNCQALNAELVRMQTEIEPIFADQNEKKTWNMGWGMTGSVIGPGYFAIDLSDAERVEIQAYQARWSWLVERREQLGCPGAPLQMVDHNGKPIFDESDY